MDVQAFGRWGIPERWIFLQRRYNRYNKIWTWNSRLPLWDECHRKHSFGTRDWSQVFFFPFLWRSRFNPYLPGLHLFPYIRPWMSMFFTSRYFLYILQINLTIYTCSMMHGRDYSVQIRILHACFLIGYTLHFSGLIIEANNVWFTTALFVNMDTQASLYNRKKQKICISLCV